MFGLLVKRGLVADLPYLGNRQYVPTWVARAKAPPDFAITWRPEDPAGADGCRCIQSGISFMTGDELMKRLIPALALILFCVSPARAAAAPNTDVTEVFARLGWRVAAPDGSGTFRPPVIR
jgi:hypothetical protein